MTDCGCEVSVSNGAQDFPSTICQAEWNKINQMSIIACTTLNRCRELTKIVDHIDKYGLTESEWTAMINCLRQHLSTDYISIIIIPLVSRNKIKEVLRIIKEFEYNFEAIYVAIIYCRNENINEIILGIGNDILSSFASSLKGDRVTQVLNKLSIAGFGGLLFV